jgi:aspartyl-tRNA(Asn)/glutamyl-tRNA(Gln) amidotransferase subunit C
MQVDRPLILKLENLARLELSEAEREQLTGDLNKILAMVEKLEELDTSNVEPLVYINEQVNVLREDEVKHQVSKEAALANAPDKDERYFKVPKVLG